MTIDWTKPLELMDGTPLVLRATTDHGNPDDAGDYYLRRDDGLPLMPEQIRGARFLIVRSDGTQWKYDSEAPLVRNRAETAASLDEVQQLRQEFDNAGKPMVEAVAKAILGPRNPVPNNSGFTLEYLREHRWKSATEHERRDAMWAAISAIAEMQTCMEAGRP